MKKQLFLFAMLLLPIMARADYSGTLGNNLTWTYDGSTKTLTISGSGAMKNYNDITYQYDANSYIHCPWDQFRENIANVIINEGVTTIGSCAFYCMNLTSVTIPNSVTSIGDKAFAYCGELTSVAIPNNVTTIGAGAFENCSSLTSVIIPYGVKKIDRTTFSYCI